MQTLVIPISTETPAVSGPPHGQWTAADWENLSHQDKRYEIIDGVLYTQDIPSNFHQWVISQLYELVGVPTKDEIYTVSLVAVIISDRTITQPDFIGIRKSNIHIVRKWIYGVPDFIAEVISPGSKDYDEEVKKTAYEKAGVPEYAVIDPATRQLRLYTLNESNQYSDPRVFKERDTVKFACVSTQSFVVRELFDGAPDTTL